MQTNRISFVDVDTSASLPQVSAITGYTVIKAPKGTIKPKYIQKGDTTTILNLFGAPSSTYPGIQEAIDFNQQYGLWVSAPGGAISAHSNYSYFGGTWLTKRASLESFYHVTEGPDGTPDIDIAYTLLDVDHSDSPYITTFLTKAYGTATLAFDNIPNFAIEVAKVQGLTLSFPRSDSTTATIPLTISGTAIHTINPLDDSDLTIGSLVTGSQPDTLKISITGSSAYDSGGYQDLDFGSVETKTWYAVSGSPATLNDYLSQVDWVLNNVSFSWVYDITDDVIMALYQSSPRVNVGTFTLVDVDTREVTYNRYTSKFALTGTTDTSSGSVVTLLGQSLTVTNGMSNTQLVTALSALSIPGYTLGTADEGTSLTATNIGPSYVAAKSTDLSFGLVTGVSSTFSTTGIGSAVTNPNYNTASFRYSEVSYPGSSYLKTFRVSTDINKTDGSGNNIYAETVLDGNMFIGAKVVNQLYDTLSTYTWTALSSSLVGTRALLDSSFETAADLPVVLQSGWDAASNDEYQDVKIFFEPECIASLATTLANYRSGRYLFSTFVTGIKVANSPTSVASEVSAAVQAIITARSGYPNITGLAYYCNEFKVTENYSGTSYWNVPTGAIAGMLAQIMEKRRGGASPMFTNENGVGGQISKSVKSQKYSFDADSLDALDSAGVNPIIKDSLYNLMITSGKTAQSPLNISDWSFLGHSMAFDLFRDEVKRSVMIPQLGKLIDNFHLNLRKEQTQIILDKRLKGATTIWAEGQVFVNEVNTPETLAQNKFMIKVRVKVYPFSEYVELIFNNVGQSSTVS